MLKVTNGILVAPIVAIVGAPAAGKTTLATSVPGTLLVSVEKPGAHIVTPTVDLTDPGAQSNPTNWVSDFWSVLGEIAASPSAPGGRGVLVDGVDGPVLNIVIDSLKPIETLFALDGLARQQASAKRPSDAPQALSDLGLNSHQCAGEMFNQMFKLLERIRMRGVQVVLLGHTARTKVKNLDGSDYETFTIDLAQGDAKWNRITPVSELLQRCDEVWEIGQPITAQEVERRIKGRMIRTSSGKPIMAGNRSVYCRPTGSRPYLKTRSPLPAVLVEDQADIWPALASRMAWWSARDLGALRAALRDLIAHVYTAHGRDGEIDAALAKVETLPHDVLLKSISVLQSRAEEVDKNLEAGGGAE